MVNEDNIEVLVTTKENSIRVKAVLKTLAEIIKEVAIVIATLILIGVWLLSFALGYWLQGTIYSLIFLAICGGCGLLIWKILM